VQRPSLADATAQHISNPAVKRFFAVAVATVLLKKDWLSSSDAGGGFDSREITSAQVPVTIVSNARDARTQARTRRKSHSQSGQDVLFGSPTDSSADKLNFPSAEFGHCDCRM
jgi:hypothetical protein